MKKHFVEIIFKLIDLPPSIRDALNEDRGLKIGIVGSIRELGSWNARQMLIAHLYKTENVWSVTARLPILTSFQWTWVIMTRDDWILCRDPAGNRQTFLNCFSGVVKATWGQTGTRFLSMTSAIKLSVHYKCQPGEVMAILGSGVSMGFWDPQKAIRAHESPVNSSNWIAEVLVDYAVDSHEWKWVVLDADSGSVKRWEDGPNRELKLDCDCLQMVDTKWNCESVVHHCGDPGTMDTHADTIKKLPFDERPKCRTPTWRSLTDRLPSLIQVIGFVRDWWI